MGERTRAMRLLCWATASAVLALASTGCSDDSSTALDTAVTASPTTTIEPTAATAATPTTVAAPAPGATSTTALPGAAATSVAATPVAVVTTVPGPATAPVDGAAVLAAAMDATAAGYHYHATVTIAGAVAIEADGDRIGDGTRLGVVRDGVAVQYVITPAGTWVQPEGGDWDQLDTPPATSDPILALRAPSSLSVDSVDGASVHMTVSVPANSLGLSGDAIVPVGVIVTGGLLSEVIYTTTVDGQPASIDTEVGPVVDPSPVVAPV